MKNKNKRDIRMFAGRDIDSKGFFTVPKRSSCRWTFVHDQVESQAC
jgi:hypothetical protein